LHAITVIN